MKKSHLQQFIKEEILNVLKESVNEAKIWNWNDLLDTLGEIPGSGKIQQKIKKTDPEVKELLQGRYDGYPDFAKAIASMYNLEESVNEFGPLAGSGNKDNLELMKRKASKKSESGDYVYVVGGSGGTYKLSKYEDEGNTHAAYYNGIQQDIEESVNESQEYYITYNKGRGQGKGLLKKTYSSYEEAKKSADMMGYNSMVAYWVSDKYMDPIKSD